MSKHSLKSYNKVVTYRKAFKAIVKCDIDLHLAETVLSDINYENFLDWRFCYEGRINGIVTDIVNLREYLNEGLEIVTDVLEIECDE